MKPILAAYATTDGHTRTVAEFIAARLRSRGHRADLLDVARGNAADIDTAYAAVFLGGSVHQHRHQGALMRFARQHRTALGTPPLALFSVSLAAAQPDLYSRLEAQRLAEAFVEETGLPHPLCVHCVAGALKYTQYGYFKRLVMYWIARYNGRDTDTSKDHEYTDWKDVEAFVDDFLAMAHLGRAAPPSLVPQRLDRVEPRGAPGREVAEQHADGRREAQRQQVDAGAEGVGQGHQLRQGD